MTTTVFTLEGGFDINLNDMESMLRGEVTSGANVVQILYNNLGIFNANVLDGVDKLDAAINSTPGPKIAFGHSLGAVVIQRWLHDKGPTCTVDPSELSFICIGNSIRKYGGFLNSVIPASWANSPWAPVTPVDVPAGNRYTVTDLARQYDGWADFPSAWVTDGSEALLNAAAGANLVHPNYQNISLSDSNIVSFTENNVTYMWSPTYPAPISGTTVNNSYSTSIDKADRPAIEANYSRPVTIPNPPEWDLPNETTAFLLDGFAWSGFMPDTRIVQSFGASQLVQVPYDNQHANYLPGITQAAATLNTYLTEPAYAGKPKIVCGISMGTQVAYKWLRDYGPTSTVDPSEVWFVLLANPENKFTGSGVIAPEIYGGGYGGIGVPDDTPYTIVNFMRQYDGVADYPNVENPTLTALLNAVEGMALLHINYFTVGLNDPHNVSHTEGNVTYTWSPTFPIPLAGLEPTSLSIPYDKQYRPAIETSYNRPVTFPDPPEWNLLVTKPDPKDPLVQLEALRSVDPLAAAQLGNELAFSAETPSTDIEVTIYDKFYKGPQPCGDYKELKVTFNRNATGTATIVLKHTDPLVDQVVKCYQEVVPVTIKTGYLKWTGRVEYVDDQYKDGEYNVTVYCTSDYQWFDKIMAWPNPLLPIQTQVPKRSLYIGPAITCVKTLISENVFRIQTGLGEILSNPLSLDLDWESWIGTLLESDGNLAEMLMTPVVVVPTDPLTDTSPWTSINGRMDKCSSLVEQVVKDNGLVLTADLWLPGDPQPAGLYATLTVPTIVVDCKDMSGVTGPTSTFLDGLIKDVVDIEHGVLGDVLSPLLNPGNEYAPEGINIAPILGINFTKPWTLFTDHPRGGLRSFTLTPHSPLAYTVIGGGKSPHWACAPWLILGGTSLELSELTI